MKVKIHMIELQEGAPYKFDLMIYHGLSSSELTKVEPDSVKYVHIHAKVSGHKNFIEVPHGIEFLNELEFMNEQTLKKLKQWPDRLMMQKMFTLDLTSFVKKAFPNKNMKAAKKIDLQVKFNVHKGGVGYLVEGISVVQQPMVEDKEPISEEDLFYPPATLR